MVVSRVFKKTMFILFILVRKLDKVILKKVFHSFNDSSKAYPKQLL